MSGNHLIKTQVKIMRRRPKSLICIAKYTVVRNSMNFNIMKLDSSKRKYILSEISASVRTPISELMKREVRQRCGFGCVICGMPLYTYEHMLGYANVHRDVAQEFTLLCYQHQYERTHGLLPVENVIRADKTPYNLQKGVSKPYTLHYDGLDCIVDIGANVFDFHDEGNSTEFVALAFDDDSLVSFKLEHGQWLLSLQAFDQHDELLLKIIDNELAYSTIPWDIELVGRNLVIREAKRNILIDILFEPPSKIKIQSGHLMHNGIEIEIKPDYLLVVNTRSKFTRCGTHGRTNALLVGNTTKTHRWGFVMPVRDRFVMSRIS